MKHFRKKEFHKNKRIFFCETVFDLLSAIMKEDNNTYLYFDDGILVAFDNEKNIAKVVNNYEET